MGERLARAALRKSADFCHYGSIPGQPLSVFDGFRNLGTKGEQRRSPSYDQSPTASPAERAGQIAPSRKFGAVSGFRRCGFVDT